MGRTRLIEHLQYIYGPLEGRTAYYTVYIMDYKLLENWGKLPQIALNYHRLPMLQYR